MPADTNPPQTCADGSYAADEGQEACAPCPAGTYCRWSEDAGQGVAVGAAPLPCPTAHYCEAGSETPTPCPAGTYGAARGFRDHSLASLESRRRCFP